MTLTERIQGKPEPVKLTERMSPFMRRLVEKRLPVKDQTIYADGCGPTGRAA
jgi:hypothetical protein